MKLSILMPAYNEHRTIRKIVDKCLAVTIDGISDREIIIVNDCSTDDTAKIISELAEQYGDKIVSVDQTRNQGKGAAIRTAIQKATGDICIIQDADMEYDPNDYSRVISPILELNADCVYGSRFASSEVRRILLFRHSLGNKFLTFLSNWFTDLNLSDMETCYKAFRTGILKTIPIRSNRFGIEPEITAKISKRGLKIFEVPISYNGRTYAEGKKIGLKDAFQALFTILKFWIIDDHFNEDYGHEILTDMQEAPNFNKWIMDLSESYLSESLLEIGSGIGNQTRSLSLRHNVLATDFSDKYLDILHNSFADNDFVEVKKWNITEPASPDIPSMKSIFCSNVLEHIEDDKNALVNMRTVLAENGNLVLIVPRGQSLFCSLDKNLNHFRRYDKADLERLAQETGFNIVEMRTFNKPGVCGWILKGKILKNQTLGKFSLKIYNIMVPLFRVIDRILPWQGLSWLLVISPSKNYEHAKEKE